MNTKVKNRNILELLTVDITKFFSNPYIEVGTEDTPAIQIVDYEAKLDIKEFDIFDTIRLRVLFDKYNIVGETHVNVSLRCKKRRTTKDDAKFLINTIVEKFGEDNNGKQQWNNDDEETFENNTLTRIWATGIGENFVSIHVKEVSGLELNILFINNLLKNMGKKIEF